MTKKKKQTLRVPTPTPAKNTMLVSGCLFFLVMISDLFSSVIECPIYQRYKLRFANFVSSV